jgi:hypothetical protein
MFCEILLRIYRKTLEYCLKVVMTDVVYIRAN